MKIIYLLPPSEGKNGGGTSGEERLSFAFEKPRDTALHATEKDLKCTGKRYEEGMRLNREVVGTESSPNHNSPCPSDIPLHEGEQKNPPHGGGEDYGEKVGGAAVMGGFSPAISCYSGVMYNAIDYSGMDEDSQKYFAEHFLILSGMYGLLKPDDEIANYKLPIETKGLYQFWGSQITETLNNLKVDIIVDFLPKSYARMINWKSIDAKTVRVNFLHEVDGELKKHTHGVKKVKGIYIKELCESQGEKIMKNDFEKKETEIDVIG